jgi:hypothetical protein
MGSIPRKAYSMKTVTLAGFVWIVYPPNEGMKHALVMFGNVGRPEANKTEDLKTKTATVPPELSESLDPSLLEVGAHIIITATYEERQGKLPLFDAQKIEAFEDGRQLNEWKDWY